MDHSPREPGSDSRSSRKEPERDSTAVAKAAEETERLIRDFSHTVHYIARKAWWLAPDPEERTQEVWVILMDRIVGPGYDPGRGSLREYVMLQLWHAALDRRRRTTLEAAQNLTLERAAGLLGQEVEPWVAYEQERVRRLVREALEAFRANVSDADFLVLAHHWIEGRSLADIARELDQKPGRIRMRHLRAFERFVVFLGETRWGALFADWMP